MDNKDSLAASLSDEEAETIVPTPVSKASPAKNEGYKFKVDPDQNLQDGFNFASKSQSNGHDTNGHSSSDAEDFEHLSAPEDTNGSDQNSAPTTPTKAIPFKRMAGAENASPPSSPAPKKRKEWKDYVAEDEQKKKKAEQNISESNAEGTGFTKKFIFVAVVILAAAILIAFYGPAATHTHNQGNLGGSKPRYTWKKASSNFFNWTKDLSTEFPMQNKETWIALIASISSTLEKTEPVHPAAITVLFPPTVSQDFALCFLHKIGRVVNKAVAPILGGNIESPAEVKVIEYSTFATDSSFSKFRPEIENYLKTRGKAAITVGIDKYKSENALLQFHGLCDNFHAVDKRATLFFPVSVPKEVMDTFEWIHDRGGDISNAVLTEAWKNVLSSDTGPALVARVTDTVILLNDGDKCSL